MMNVEIWSDVVCPWCAVGKVRFERALAQFPHADHVTVRWRSFELDRHAPASRDGDYVDMLARKYRTSTGQAQQMIDRMTASGAEEGLAFRFDIARPGNTFDAHRVLHLAADRDLQHPVKDRFLAGYHEEGAAIADHQTIHRLAVDAGLDDVEVKEVLDGDAYASAVRADEEQALEYGITGVPFFVVDGRYGLNGAQPSDTILATLTQAWESRNTDDQHATHRHEGDTCGAEGCAAND